MTHTVGIDPGTHSGVCVIDAERVIVAAWTVRVPTALVDAAREILGNTQAIWDRFHPSHAVLEDVITGGAYRQKFGHPIAIAKLNSIMGMWGCGLAGLRGYARHQAPAITTVSPQKWYPKFSGRSLTKRDAVTFLREQAREQRALLTNEHLTMAYGLARYGWACQGVMV